MVNKMGLILILITLGERVAHDIKNLQMSEFAFFLWSFTQILDNLIKSLNLIIAY